MLAKDSHKVVVVGGHYYRGRPSIQLLHPQEPQSRILRRLPPAPVQPHTLACRSRLVPEGTPVAWGPPRTSLPRLGPLGPGVSQGQLLQVEGLVQQELLVVALLGLGLVQAEQVRLPV